MGHPSHGPERKISLQSGFSGRSFSILPKRVHFRTFLWERKLAHRLKVLIKKEIIINLDLYLHTFRPSEGIFLLLLLAPFAQQASKQANKQKESHQFKGE